jgi:hypothetical protein
MLGRTQEQGESCHFLSSALGKKSNFLHETLSLGDRGHAPPSMGAGCGMQALVMWASVPVLPLPSLPFRSLPGGPPFLRESCSLAGWYCQQRVPSWLHERHRGGNQWDTVVTPEWNLRMACDSTPIDGHGYILLVTCLVVWGHWKC